MSVDKGNRAAQRRKPPESVPPAAEPQLEAVPFMLVSSETSFASLDPVRQAGVVAILPKPFDPS